MSEEKKVRGRPRKTPVASTQVQVRLSNETLARMDRMIHALHELRPERQVGDPALTRSDIIRLALDKFLREV